MPDTPIDGTIKFSDKVGSEIKIKNFYIKTGKCYEPDGTEICVATPEAIRTYIEGFVALPTPTYTEGDTPLSLQAENPLCKISISVVAGGNITILPADAKIPDVDILSVSGVKKNIPNPAKDIIYLPFLKAHASVVKILSISKHGGDWAEDIITQTIPFYPITTKIHQHNAIAFQVPNKQVFKSEINIEVDGSIVHTTVEVGGTAGVSAMVSAIFMSIQFKGN